MLNNKEEIKILVITPVKHITGVADKLKNIGSTTFIDDPNEEDLQKIISEFDVIFTNPNKSKIFLGKKILGYAQNLKIICTASTGTNHIDINYTTQNKISVLSLTEERNVINKISSTAEHAFALTMASIRNIIGANSHVQDGLWDYEKFIGRQIDGLTVGIIGYGRLGSLYGKYCKSFGSKILAYDPYKEISDPEIIQVENINHIFVNSDVISIHVHVTDKTIKMINKSSFKKMKSSVLIVNTSRGEVINEDHLVDFLSKNKNSKVATDVLYDEINNRTSSSLLNYSKNSNQVIITPHIGGMTKEAQEIAYNHATVILKDFIKKNY